MSAVLERKDLQCRFTKARSNGQFEAVIATLGVVDSDGDIIMPGAFGDATVSILPAHNHGSVPLGKARMEDRGNEAIATGQFNLDIQAGKEWHSALKFDLENGDVIQEWSFAFNVLDSEDETRNGQRVRVLKKLDVMEVSPVLRGAGVDTRTLVVKHRPTSDFGSALDELDDSMEDLSRLLGRATADQLTSARPVAEPILSRIDRFLDDLVGGKGGIGDLMYAKWIIADATIVLDDLDRERFKYAFCDVDELTRNSASKIVELVADSLGIRAPVIKFFRPVDTGDKPDFGCREEINGLTRFSDVVNGRPTIYVRAREFGKMIGTLAHETRHVWQRQKGWNMADKDHIEEDAYAFGDGFALKCDLPMYADLVVTEDYPPTKFGTAGSLFGLFHFNRKSGQIHRAYGDAPWPRWVHHRTVDLGRV